MVAASAETAPELAAKTLANNAAEQIKKNGVDAACKTFADPNGGFIEGELYVFVHDMNAKMICHAANPKLNGKDLLELKDADGKYFEKTIVETIKSKGSGWVDYRWINPTTHEIQAKSTYVESVNNVIIGVGIYKK
ncbi:MAG TPA: cache domain-containing protein [Burkholderiaceae bacterium]|jgi:signal transduction histidine kinase